MTRDYSDYQVSLVSLNWGALPLLVMCDYICLLLVFIIHYGIRGYNMS